jgi:hypothetical protein
MHEFMYSFGIGPERAPRRAPVAGRLGFLEIFGIPKDFQGAGGAAR